MATGDISGSKLYLKPNGYKAGLLMSEQPTDGTGDLTVARVDSTPVGTEINDLGQIQNVAANIPKFTHNTIGGCPVLNVEPNTTQLITYPITFSNAYWTKTGASLVSSQASPHTSYPTGAFKLVEDTSSGLHKSEIGAGVTVSASTDYNLSFIVKKVDKTYIAFGLSYSTSQYAVVQINLNTKTVVYSNAIGGHTIANTKIINLADDYILVSATFQTLNTITFPFIALTNGLFSSGGINDNTYTGDGTSSAYIFGANLTQTSGLHSFINPITEGSTTVTNSDIIGGNDLSSLGTIKTIFVRFNLPYEITTLNTNYILTLSGSNDGALTLGSLTGSFSNELISFGNTSVGISYYALPSGTITKGEHSIALVWDGAKYQIYLDGSAVTTSVYLTPALYTADEFYFGFSSTTPFNGFILDTQLYSTALTASQIASL